MQRYCELRAYKEEHGDTIVPYKTDGGLDGWVHKQRTAYREHCGGKRSMPKERINRLNSIGFVWRVTQKRAPN